MSIIVNADDFGLSKSVNEAIKQCFKNVFINRTTVMTNMPGFQEAIKIAESNGFKDKVGLHLTLDEGIPLTEGIRNNCHFCKDNHFVKGCMFKPQWLFYMSKYDRTCLEREIEAQMQTYVDAGFTLMHLDSHHFVHTSSPLILNIVIKKALKFGFKSMRNIAIYPEDMLVKRILKKYVKYKIEKRFITTKHFAQYRYYSKGDNDIEYMSHPDIIQNELVDVLDRKISKTIKFKTLQ